jgi:hypothetical protein
MTTKEKYTEFLKSKMAISHQSGFDVSVEEMTPALYPHVKDSVKWAIKGGCRAIFSNFGMHKTVTQLEIERLIIKYEGGKGLIVCPVDEPVFLLRGQDKFAPSLLLRWASKLRLSGGNPVMASMVEEHYKNF